MKPWSGGGSVKLSTNVGGWLPPVAVIYEIGQLFSFCLSWSMEFFGRVLLFRYIEGIGIFNSML